MISKRVQHVAEGIAHRLPLVLTKRRLTPAIERYALTEVNGMPILVAPLDTHRIERLEQYASEDLLRQIAAEVGYPVFLASKGMGYVFLLGNLPRLPRRVDFPLDAPLDVVSMGVGIGGAIRLSWKDLGTCWWPGRRDRARAFSCACWCTRRCGTGCFSCYPTWIRLPSRC